MISTLCKQIYTKTYIKHKKNQKLIFFQIFAKIKKFDSNFLNKPQKAPIMTYTRRIRTFHSFDNIWPSMVPSGAFSIILWNWWKTCWDFLQILPKISDFSPYCKLISATTLNFLWDLISRWSSKPISIIILGIS